MIKFEKVSFEQFEQDWNSCGYAFAKDRYLDIKIPKRATIGSAGYDFYTPMSFELNPGESIKIPTGIKAQMSDGVVLMLFPRSSLGFKYQLQLCNSVGIIDMDYFNNKDNEGHIFIKLKNNGDKIIHIEQGDAIVQGIFINYLKTVDDDIIEERIGGIGSTNKV